MELGSSANKMRGSAEDPSSGVLMTCRMFFSVKALLYGEDFTSDPVSTAVGFCLRAFSRGRLVVNLQQFSQVDRSI
jgi:hypothetical protein